MASINLPTHNYFLCKLNEVKSYHLIAIVNDVSLKLLNEKKASEPSITIHDFNVFKRLTVMLF